MLQNNNLLSNVVGKDGVKFDISIDKVSAGYLALAALTAFPNIDNGINIGGDPYGAGLIANGFVGYLRNFKLFNTVLTQTEIQNLWHTQN